MLIAGQRVDGPARIEVRNPARPDDLVGTIVRGAPEHVDQAVAALDVGCCHHRTRPEGDGLWASGVKDDRDHRTERDREEDGGDDP